MVDKIDVKILEVLKNNSRLSFAEIGRMINLSPSSVRERIQKLEDSQIILGYNVNLNYKLLEYDLEAFILVKVFHGKLTSFLNVLNHIEEIVEAHRIIGNQNVHLKVLLKNQIHLQELIDRLMAFGDTQTLLVLSKVK
ncbi:Lrp/AsnC family transcriptional regulator [Abyssalbus ytuae]|uniref:Lrp/AsnC family transcriptional regulator n=1 Tax=Abyssalbus ytuae TaxID=2926907 RepID=A0A9E6ZML6_9FLAO|nr:Lrp/AsnC family transcriptional regulator [Abyssalbus ytuae]UOB17464.1 Lrp/AsnC family transcriptional regulator [Abyssalbus ytuae]